MTKKFFIFAGLAAVIGTSLTATLALNSAQSKPKEVNLQKTSEVKPISEEERLGLIEASQEIAEARRPKCKRTFKLKEGYDVGLQAKFESPNPVESVQSFGSIKISYPGNNDPQNTDIPHLSWVCGERYLEENQRDYWEDIQQDSTPVNLAEVRFISEEVKATITEARRKNNYLGYYFLLDKNNQVYEYFYIKADSLAEKNIKINLT